MSGIFKGDSIYKSGGGGGGGYAEGGELIDADFIKVENNTVSSYDNITRDPINFYLEVQNGEVLNSYIELTTVINTTVNVYILRNGLYFLLGNLGGKTCNAGDDYKVSIIGDSYSIEQVNNLPEDPDFISTKIGPIPIVKIGNKYWATENLSVTWSGLPIGSQFVAFDGFYALWYNDDAATMNGRQAGLLYSARAADYIESNIEDLIGEGWKVPTPSEMQSLNTLYPLRSEICKQVCYNANWGGINNSKLSFVPTGFHNGGAFYYYPNRAFLWGSGWSGSFKNAFTIRDDESTWHYDGSGTRADAYAIRIYKQI